MVDIDYLTTVGSLLANRFSQVLAISMPNPKWDKKQAGWRHEIIPSKVSLFFLMKTAGSISTTNAMLFLIKQGFMFQAGILARTIREANLSISFMFPKPDMKVGEWPSKKQDEALIEFFKETWEDPEKPFKDNAQRSQILLRELAASLGHFQEKGGEISQHDAGQTAVQVLRFLSDYTHMAYPRLMELFEYEQGYILLGGQNGPTGFDFEQAALIVFNSCTTANDVTLFTIRNLDGVTDLARLHNNQQLLERVERKLNKLKGLRKDLEELCTEIEAHFPVTPSDPKKLLRRFKGK